MLQANAMATVAELRDFLPVGAERALEDWQARFEDAINIASNRIEAACRRTFATVPVEVERACVLLAASLLDARGKDPRARVERGRDGEVVEVERTDPVTGLPLDVLDLVRAHVQVAVSDVVPGT